MICQALDILQMGRLHNAKTPPNYSIVSKQASLFCGSTSTGRVVLKEHFEFKTENHCNKAHSSPLILISVRNL
jgi:hypothetical protein